MATTQEELTKAVSMVRNIDKHLTKFEKDFKEVSEGLQSGIDDESKEELELWKPKLAPAVTEIDQMLDACSQALASTTAVNKDQAFMKTRGEPVAKLITHLVKTQKKYAEWAKKARQLGEDATKALGTVAKTLKSAESALGAVKNRVGQSRGEVDKLDTNSDKWKKICQDAAAKHEDKTAEPARKALLDALASAKPFAVQTRKDLKKLQDDYPDLPAAMAVEVTRLGDSMATVEGLIKKADALYLELLAMKQKAMASKAEAPMIPMAELKKDVAKLVGIDPKDSTKMTLLHRLMNTTVHDKWAEQFVKHFHVKDGKDIVRKIDKLPYFVKQANLIDI